MLRIAIYASNHGFGHASRVSALADSFCKYGVITWVCTNRPKFLFDGLDPDYFRFRVCNIDHGVIHKENLVTDIDATKDALLKLFASRDEIVAAETRFLRDNNIDLVIADIPFFIVEACGYANIPVFGISNFDWAFVYGEIFAHDPQMKPILNTIWGLYRRMDKSYLLPFGNSSSVPGFLNPTLLGLLARQKEHYLDVNEKLGINQNMLLVMFGGEGGIDLSWDELCSAWQGVVISTNTEVKALNHICVKPDEDFLSLVHHAHTVLCKPGYSTFAELTQMGKPIIYIPRNNYPEERVLIEGINTYEGPICITNPKISADEWRFVFTQVSSGKPVPNSNNDIAGHIIQDYMTSKYPEDRILSIFDLGSNNLNYCLYNKSTSEVIHRHWCTTKLGRDFSMGSLSERSIENTKTSVTALLQMDAQISSNKHLIATGVSRKAGNSTVLMNWFRENWNIKSKVISGYDEMKYAYLAARQSVKLQGNILVCDIGGFSTEIAFLDEAKKIRGWSTDIGLLTIPQSSDWQTRLGELSSKLPDGDFTIVIVGLTATLLASSIRKTTLEFAANCAACISDKELVSFLEDIDSLGFKQDINSNSPDTALYYAGKIIKQIVDRYRASSFMVSNDGISTGYALWIK